MTRFRLLNWWISRTWTGWHIFFGICGTAICLVGMMTGVLQLTRWGTWGIGVLVIVHLLHAVLHQMDVYLKTLERVDRVPIFQMKQVTGFYLIVFLLAFMMLAWLGSYFPWKTAGGLIGGYLVAVIRWFVSLFFHGEQIPPQKPDRKPEHVGVLALPTGETSALAIWMDRILIVVFWIAVFAAVIWLCRLLIRRIFYWMSSLHFDGDEKQFLKPEQDRKKRLHEDKQRGNLGRRVGRMMDLSINGRIRGQYRSGIRRRLAKDQDQILSFLTPEETELLAGLEKNDEMRMRMHEIYEKARYSRTGCERSELEEMKNMR